MYNVWDIVSNGENKYMKTKTWIYGAGNYYRNKLSSIKERYSIEYVIDNNVDLKLDCTCMTLQQLKDKYDKEDRTTPIIIMRTEYVSAWKELRSIGIVNPVIFPYCFNPLMGREVALFSNGETVSESEEELQYMFNGQSLQMSNCSTMDEFEKIVEKNKIGSSFLCDAPLQPLNRTFGISRGTPIDRYYIESWLEVNKDLIAGSVLEIAENTYTTRYGGEKVTNSYMLHVERDGYPFIKGNLETGEGIQENIVDCIVLTQTLGFIYDYRAVLENLYKILKSGGVVLLTTGGISQISRYDMDKWGHYWMFTSAAIKKMIENSSFGSNYTVETFGNVKAACSLLYGVSAEELSKNDLDYIDEDYEMIHCIRLYKK